MSWESNLSKALNESGYSDIEIHAWTSISTSVLSNMRNKRHKHLTCEQFLLLMLILKMNYNKFINQIFGEKHFSAIKKIEPKKTLTKLGHLVTKRNKYELFSKNELAAMTKISSNRLEYIFNSEDNSIRIEELTKIELAFGEIPGTLCKIRFSNIKLNTQTKYNALLQKQRDVNNRANSRRSRTSS